MLRELTITSRQTQTFAYDTRVWPFRDVVQGILGCAPELIAYDTPLATRETDQQTPWHAQFYRSAPEYFLPLYRQFVRGVVRPMFGEDIVYQRIPTFRVHRCGNLAVGAFHKDKEYNHSLQELNFWLPVTDTNAFNTIWLETAEDRGDFMPILVKYGEVLIFDGANLRHGNQINESEATRVSVDFRIIRHSEYVESDLESVNTKTKFKIGEYFLSTREW